MKGVMEINRFPLGSVIQLRTGGRWWRMVEYINYNRICVLVSLKKEIKCYRGVNTLVVDWLVGA